MKKLIYLFNLVPLVALGQIPVTDAATNGSLGIANNQLAQIHIQLRSLGNQVAATNRKLDRLIDLMEKNNDQTTRSREILKDRTRGLLTSSSLPTVWLLDAFALL